MGKTILDKRFARMSEKINKIRLVQISDAHLQSVTSELINAVNPHQRLSRLIDYVNKNDYDFLILSGDLADSGHPNSYQQINKLLKTVSIPVLMFSGNHDDPVEMEKIFENHANCHLAPKVPVLVKDWRLIYIDTVVPGEKYGYVSEKSIVNLNEQLQEAGSHNVVVFMHHNPFPTGVPKIDRCNLQNYDVVQACLTSNVKLVCYGHIHHDVCHWNNGVMYSACPSAAFQANEVGYAGAKLYGLKEYELIPESISAKPIWFMDKE